MTADKVGSYLKEIPWEVWAFAAAGVVVYLWGDQLFSGIKNAVVGGFQGPSLQQSPVGNYVANTFENTVAGIETIFGKGGAGLPPDQQPVTSAQ